MIEVLKNDQNVSKMPMKKFIFFVKKQTVGL